MSSHADTIRAARALHELGVRNHGWYMTEAEHRGVLDVLVRQEAENQRYEKALERLRDTPPRAMRDYEAFVLDVSQKALAGDEE